MIQPNFIIVDLSQAVNHMEEKTHVFARGVLHGDTALTEMLTQCFDYLSDSSIQNNPFSDHWRVPHLVDSMIPGLRLDDRQTSEEIRNAFVHLYVAVRDIVAYICGADALIKETGSFDYVLWQFHNSRTVVLRRLAT